MLALDLRRRTDLADCSGEWDRNTVLEQQGLEFLGDGLVHDGAVPVPLDVCLEPLLFQATPANDTSLRAGGPPSREPGEVPLHALRILMCDQVQEGKTKAAIRLQVLREVQEVVAAGEAPGVEHFLEHRACVVVRDSAA